MASDEPKAVVWQPVGRYFRARVLFESGLISDASHVIEPILPAGVSVPRGSSQGVFRAINGVALVVGDDVIREVWSRASLPDKIRAATRQSRVASPVGNFPSVVIHYASDEDGMKIRKVLKPVFLPEGFSGPWWPPKETAEV